MHELLPNESQSLNWYVWLGALALMSAWEAASPRLSLSTPLRRRWSGNFSLMLLGIFLVWWIAPVLGLEFSSIVTARQWGLLPNLGWPLWLNVLLGVVVLDLARYLLHWAAHHNALLWRIHRVHHTDQDFDFTTSARFHPIELALVTALNLGIIACLGLHPIAILISETLSLAVNTFNHGNVRIPDAVDRALRLVLVTPDMHRIHHSSEATEFDANLGGLVPWWDRLFGTYVAQPARGHEGMLIGLPAYSEPKHATLWWMLANPLLSVESKTMSESSLPKQGGTETIYRAQ